LASIRDYNSGCYFHPELSRCYPPDLVDCSLKLHHEEVFQNLLEAPVRAYLDQLRLYIAFSGVPRAELIRTWSSLEAYKSAIPLQYDRHTTDLFCLNVLTALSILEQAG
jgi:hypothetical protein